MTLQSELSELSGIGPALFKKFKAAGIVTVADLLDYYPRHYDDYSQVTPINKLRPGAVSLKAVIKQAKGRYLRRRLHITEAIASDDSGSVRLVWFNQPYRAASLNSDQPYFISGQYELGRGRFAIMNPAVERVSDLPANTARILAVYRESKGLNSRQIRQSIIKLKPLIEDIPETLPDWLIKEHKLLSKAEAITALHLPNSAKEVELAKRRLGFEEVFELSLASLLNKRENKAEQALAIRFDESLAKEFVKALPFRLTDDQRRAIWQIYLDIQKTEPMNRLVEGDVGSGKTAVAAMAALMVLNDTKQAALMAPTELLARQHYQTISQMLAPLGYQDKVILLTGSLSAAQKKAAHELIKSGQAGFMIGTQALIQEKVDMHSLCLIVIDEQHRFGVDQRKALMQKAGHMPHVLSLTATPIPRSLALTLYGEMDISLLKEKPAGRLVIKTDIVAPTARDRLNSALDQRIASGEQVYVVCPSIESDEEDIASAEAVYKELSTKQFKHRRLGLLHGRLKSGDKQDIMQRFIDGEIDMLVSTTVIEVGVDVPNASVMVIFSAERFGLAQLHQLRGRVGRGQHPSHCYLLLDSDEAPSKRLRALTTFNDGFKLAELDLSIRGPGAIYGRLQHGALDLRVAELNDLKLINEARQAAMRFIEKDQDLLEYEELNAKVSRLRAVTNLN